MNISVGIPIRGKLRIKKIKACNPSLYRIVNKLHPRWITGWIINRLARGFSHLTGVPTVTGELRGMLIRDGEEHDLGVLSYRVVTTAGVNFIVDAWQNSLELEIMKYHGVGTGTNAEAAGDTTLQTESTTILNPDSTRATGSLTEGATANVFKTVGTITFDGSGSITEHGLFSQAATGGGTLFDRSVFTAIAVVATDTLQFTYEATFNSGG